MAFSVWAVDYTFSPPGQPLRHGSPFAAARRRTGAEGGERCV